MATNLEPALESRLGQLEPHQTVRVVVMVDVAPTRKSLLQVPERRMTDQERHGVVEAMREAARPALAEIDEILGRFGGKRLDESVGALGTVLVEATAEGIRALAGSPKIKAVMPAHRSRSTHAIGQPGG